MAKDWLQDLNSANLKDISNSALDDGVFDYTETLTLLESVWEAFLRRTYKI